MIYVVATVELKPGTPAAYLRDFAGLVPKVRAEEGCIEYGPAIDVHTGIAAQMPFRANTVTIMEKWESLAHLKEHLAQPHMAEYRRRVKDYVAGSSLQILEPAPVR